MMLQTRMVQKLGMHSILLDALGPIQNKQLSNAILNGFEIQAHSLQKIESSFKTLVSSVWPESVLKDFFNAWRDTHLSSGSVAAIVCRLLAERGESELASYNLIESARAVAQTIHEDLGLCGETHAKLYERLANSLCHGDDWKLDKHKISEAADFSQWIQKRRIEENLKSSLLATIASEIYNHCEYTFIAPIFRQWMLDVLAFEPEQIQRNMAYILVHTGATEHEHFLHCVNSLQFYLAANESTLNLDDITNALIIYLQQLEMAHSAIHLRLSRN